MNRTTLPAAILAVLLALAPVAAAAVTVEDGSGDEVELAEPAKRIVSLAPHATELLFDAGAGERVVAVSSHSDYPREATERTDIGGYSGPDMEAILAAEPDLVVAWGEGNPRGPVRRLRELGVPVFVSDPRGLADIPAELAALGRLAGSEETAAAAADDFRERLDDLREAHAGAEPLRLFYAVWDRPLTTLSRGHPVTEVMELCGGENVFADAEGASPRVGEEAVLEAEPEVIIAGGMGDEQPEWLERWRQWPELPAVADDNLYFIKPDILQRTGPRLVEGAERLCAVLDEAREKRGSATGDDE
ncbi:cobalamin-binding protein [Thiohalospira sp.]|uniref:cobalamin-binding protein n=1 Tax=Thiohalospira sp. TaxID=3080549 RepID=UPI0039818CD2